MTITKRIDEQEVFDYLLTCPEGTKLYLGADSERYRDRAGNWFAKYCVVLVYHLAGSKGCHVVYETSIERDYDNKASRPMTRMFMEATKISDLYSRIEAAIKASGFEVSIHLDINPDEQHGSNCAAGAAVGYVKAMTNIDPELKPNAFAASYAADRSGDFW